MIWARYLFLSEQRLNFSMMMFISTSNFSFKKTVKSIIWNKEMIDLFEKNKKVSQRLEKMIRKEEFLTMKEKKNAYM